MCVHAKFTFPINTLLRLILSTFENMEQIYRYIYSMFFSKNLTLSTPEQAYLYRYIYVFPKSTSILCTFVLHLCKKKVEHRCTLFYISLSHLFLLLFFIFLCAASFILLSSSLLLYARKMTMHFNNLLLLHQLAEEYIQLINTTLSIYVPKEISTFEEECDSIGTIESITIVFCILLV